MQESTSRLLRVVVAAALINAMPDGRATTYNDDGIRVIGYRVDDGVDWYVDDYSGYDDWDFNDQPEPSDAGDDETSEEKQAVCSAIAAKVNASCDLSSPPLLVMNGCGSEGSELVPDYLIVGLTPVFRLGAIFTPACNNHDVCYGEYPADKDACDSILHTDMVESARRQMTNWQWAYYQIHVHTQAVLYSEALKSPFLAGASEEAFNAAQASGACRHYSKKADDAGCFQ